MILFDWSISDISTWQWLDPEQVMATTSALTVLLLLFAGVAAWFQVVHGRDARREQSRPFVVVDVLGSRAQLFRLEIKNIGKTIARDVSITFDPPLESTRDEPNRKVRNVPIIRRGAPSLAPGKRHSFILDKALDRKNSGLPDTYRVTVAYSAYDGTGYEEEHVIDLGVYWNTPDLRERDLHDIWHLLHEMNEHLHGLHQAVVDLKPRDERQKHFPPLGRAVMRPGPIQQMPRSIEGGGLPIVSEEEPEEDGEEDSDTETGKQ